MNIFQNMRSAAFSMAALFFCGLVLIIPVGDACGQSPAQPASIPLKTPPVNDFAVPPPPVVSEIKPNFKEKSFALADAANVREVLAATGPFDQDMLKFLEKNRFILLPGSRGFGSTTTPETGHDEMLSRFDRLGGGFYEHQRMPQNARFVGPDVFLHAFGVYLDLRREAVESDQLRRVMRLMLEELLADVLRLKERSSGTSRENWDRLAAQVIIALVLITNGEDPPPRPPDAPHPPPSDTLEKALNIFNNYRADLPEDATRKIKAELERIYKAESRAAGLVGLTPRDGGEMIDYTRFAPSGRHGHKASSRSYFRAMTWLSELGWDLDTPDGLADALNCVLAMSYDSAPAGTGGPSAPAIKAAASSAPERPAGGADPSDAWQAWAFIMEISHFFNGPPDAPGFQQWLPFLMKEAAVDRFTADTAADEAVLNRLAAASDSLTAGQPFFHELRKPEAGRVLCFFPARRPLTGLLSAELTRRPGVREDAPAVFSALYLPALMGHKYSRELVAGQISLDSAAIGREAEDSDEFRARLQRSRAALTALMDSWAAKLGDLPEPRRFNSLDSIWLNLIAALSREYGSGYPLYMRTPAFQARQLETIMGSNAERLCGAEFEPGEAVPAPENEAAVRGEAGDEPAAPVVRGFVEPNPVFWREMIRVVKYTAEGFKKRGLFPEDLEENGTLVRFLKRLERCAALSEKELTGEALSDDEYEFIRLFTLDFMAAPVGGTQGPRPGRRTALVTDIWTAAANPDGEERPATVYEANAEPRLMLVMVGNDKSPRLTVGLAYNHYEIFAPNGLRLTNERWRKVIYSRRDDAPSAKHPKLPPKNFWYDPLRP